MIHKIRLATRLASLSILAACQTVPEPEPVIIAEPEPVIVMPVRTCIPVNELERKVIPAVIKRGTSVTSIENTPVFSTDPETGEVRDVTPPPQEVFTPFEVIITPEQVYYVNGEGKVVDDICPEEIVLVGPTPALSPTLAPIITAQ